MRGLNFGHSREIKDPSAEREFSKREKPRTWQEGVEMFKGKAEEMYNGHLLCQDIKNRLADLKREHRRVEEIPETVYQKMSDETGYQAELIAALTLKIHQEDIVAKRKLQ